MQVSTAERIARVRARVRQQTSASAGAGEWDSPLAHYDNPVDFIQNEMYIPETPGMPMVLHPEIQRVLRKMFAFDGNMLRYTTMVYSSIKKSGKTTICAGIALWQAYRVGHGEIYIVGNDLKQADNRMNQAIRHCIAHNPHMGNVKVNRNTSYLPNGTRIEAVPVDARGEAGSNPTGIFWTEVWGAKDRKHEEMWSEMSLSPTRQGQSFKLCESYAGHSGESNILERLYISAVKPENLIDVTISPELYADGRMIVYWNTRRYLEWQTNDAAREYYAQEAREKTPDEFRRQHHNEWVSATQKFIDIELWDACKGAVKPLDKRTPVVLALDAGVTSDCFALVAVYREGDQVFVPYAHIWTPPKGGKLDFALPEAEVRRLCREFHVLSVAYDPYQLHDMATRLSAELATPFHEFSQGGDRLEADKQLYDRIRERRITHNGDPDLREHVQNANRKADADKLRIVKRADHLKIDACVCLSMGAEEIMRYSY